MPKNNNSKPSNKKDNIDKYLDQYIRESKYKRLVKKSSIRYKNPVFYRYLARLYQSKHGNNNSKESCKRKSNRISKQPERFIDLKFVKGSGCCSRKGYDRTLMVDL